MAKGEEKYARSKRKNGSGLGLPIAKWIVTNLNGNINIESIENKGFYRTQSKIATELIIEHCYFLFRSISTNCETNSISLSLNPVTSIFLVFVMPNK